MYDESLESSDVVEGVEVQLGSSEIALDAGPGLDYAAEPVVQQDALPETLPADAVETVVGGSAAVAQVSDTLSEERVAQVVEAVLESDRVTGLIDSFTYSLDTLSDAVMALAASEPEEREEQEPVVVISADELLDRLEARQAETAKAAQDAAQSSVRSSPMGGQTVTASMTKGGELVPVEEGEVTLAVIETLIEALIDFFTQDGTEDGTDVLTSIKDTVEEIAANVEPHPLLDTPFEDYTVVEGLLLVLVLWLAVLNPCIKMVKGGFSWLLS